MISFGNGGQLVLPNWNARFAIVSPFGTSNEVGDISSIDAPPDVLAKSIASVRPQLLPQTAELFFDPELGEPAYLTDGNSVQAQYVYPPQDSGATISRQGPVRIVGYADGGLLDDEIMVGQIELIWDGGVALSDLTFSIVDALLLSGQPWVTLEGPTVGVRI